MRPVSADAANRELTAVQHLHFHNVGRGKWIGWNRFYPVIFVFNKNARDILEKISRKEPVKPDPGVLEFIGYLKKHGFVYPGAVDPSKTQFMQTVRENLETQDRLAGEFYSEKRDFRHLTIANDSCNLACPYCVNQYKNTFIKKHADAKKLEVINRCVDQYFTGKIRNGKTEARIAFNGGEILVDWPVIKAVVERIAGKYGGINTHYVMNTNLTLMTEEMARFFKKHQFVVNISIDGYKAAHNRTRKFHDGRNSFDKIIKNLRMYNEINTGKPIRSFQGTIEFPGMFRPHHVYRMERHGFAFARLAPNLLNTGEKEAKKKARIMGSFLKMNPARSFKVKEALFTTMKKRMNREQYRYDIQCRGLNCFPDAGIELNISKLRLSLLCGFIHEATLGFNEMNNDIYSTRLWEVSRGFLERRVESLFKNCMECQLAAICAGGCILSGLDNENKINPSGCSYLEEMWKIYIEKVFRDRVKPADHSQSTSTTTT